jgi:hypothetical protein
MEIFPIISTATGRVVSGATTGVTPSANADTLSEAINRRYGSTLVRVGEPVEINPAYSKSRDPNRVVLDALIAAALESNDRPEWIK